MKKNKYSVKVSNYYPFSSIADARKFVKSIDTDLEPASDLLLIEIFDENWDLIEEFEYTNNI